MRRNCLVAIVFSIVVLIVGFACESESAAAEETEILKITVGEPTFSEAEMRHPTDSGRMGVDGCEGCEHRSNVRQFHRLAMRQST